MFSRPYEITAGTPRARIFDWRSNARLTKPGEEAREEFEDLNSTFPTPFGWKDAPFAETLRQGLPVGRIITVVLRTEQGLRAFEKKLAAGVASARVEGTPSVNMVPDVAPSASPAKRESCPFVPSSNKISSRCLQSVSSPAS